MYHSVIQKIQSNEKNVFACSVLSLHTKDQTERDVAMDRTYLPGGEGESEGSSQVWHQSQILCLVLDDLHLFLILWAKLSATVRDGKYMCALFRRLNVFKMSLHTQKPLSLSHNHIQTKTDTQRGSRQRVRRPTTHLDVDAQRNEPVTFQVTHFLTAVHALVCGGRLAVVDVWSCVCMCLCFSAVLQSSFVHL